MKISFYRHFFSDTCNKLQLAQISEFDIFFETGFAKSMANSLITTSLSFQPKRHSGIAAVLEGQSGNPQSHEP